MEQELKAKFDDIYDDIVRDTSFRVKMTRQKLDVYILICGCVLVLFSMLLFFVEAYRPYWKLALALSCIATLFLLFSSKQLYAKKYKQILIGSILKYYRPRAQFDCSKGLSRFDYKNADFGDKFNDYYSEDRIADNLESGERFELCEALVTEVEKIRHSSKDIEEKRNVKFSGMFGMVTLNKKVRNDVYINVDSVKHKFDKDRIEIESAEFEKYFDVLSKDRVAALQIFTTDIFEKILEYKKINHKYFFELRIKGNKVYFRLSCGRMFEPPVVGDGIHRDLILHYFRLIYYPIEILEALVDNINSYAALADIPDYEENDPIKNN